MRDGESSGCGMTKTTTAGWREQRLRDGERGNREMAKTAVARWRKRQPRDGENGGCEMAKAAKKILTFCLIVLKMHPNY